MLRPGPWLDFTDSVQAWQGQHDVVQLALSKKSEALILFYFFLFFSHVALLMWLLAAGSSSLFSQDQTEEEEAFVLPESTPVLPGGHAHMNEHTRPHGHTEAHTDTHIRIHNHTHTTWLSSCTYTNTNIAETLISEDRRDGKYSGPFDFAQSEHTRKMHHCACICQYW